MRASHRGTDRVRACVGEILARACASAFGWWGLGGGRRWECAHGVFGGIRPPYAPEHYVSILTGAWSTGQFSTARRLVVPVQYETPRRLGVPGSTIQWIPALGVGTGCPGCPSCPGSKSQTQLCFSKLIFESCVTTVRRHTRSTIRCTLGSY